MKAALLDINVLLALAWPDHQHHAAAHGWFAQESRLGWATCAFTQLGFIRLSSNPAYTSGAVIPVETARQAGGRLVTLDSRLQIHDFQKGSVHVIVT